MNKKTCKHCQKEFDVLNKPKGWMANHSRWCDKNPKCNEYRNRGTSWSKGQTKLTDPRLAKMADSIKKAHSLGKYNNVDRSNFGGTKHWTNETPKKISEAARKSKHRRLQRNIVEYNGILFDSSWEVKLAKLLDNNNVIWKRPNPLEYVDKQGLTRNYFPDFYLPKYDLYIDPKNPQAYKVQKDKIDCLKEQYDNILFLTSIEEIENFASVLALPSKQ